jgi:hypothetical protein
VSGALSAKLVACKSRWKPRSRRSSRRREVRLPGLIGIADQIKPDAARSVARLRPRRPARSCRPVAITTTPRCLTQADIGSTMRGHRHRDRVRDVMLVRNRLRTWLGFRSATPTPQQGTTQFPSDHPLLARTKSAADGSALSSHAPAVLPAREPCTRVNQGNRPGQARRSTRHRSASSGWASRKLTGDPGRTSQVPPAQQNDHFCA